MPLFLLKIAKWLAGKGLIFAIAGGVVVLGFALGLFISRSYAQDGQRSETMIVAQQQAREVYQELEDTHGRLVQLGKDLEQSRTRIENLSRQIEFLDSLLSKIERLFTMSASERREREKELEEAKRQRSQETEQEKTLVAEQSELRINRLTLSEQAKILEQQISALESSRSPIVDAINEAWEKTRPYLLVALAGAILIPIGWKVFAYFIWAPLLSAAGPIHLERDEQALPQANPSGVSAKLHVSKGESLWTKEAFLQASDESLRRRTRFVLDWSIPATCLAAGLVELVELSGKDFEGDVTLSSQKRTEVEVSVLELPENSSVVVRPSSIVAVAANADSGVKIRRRWRLLHPQAWLTLQFRYFIFEGPCKIVVSGVRGVRCETLDTHSEKGRRTNQVATIGFTPTLRCGVVRAETFWGYFRGFNPLFDDVFRGKGVFLCQEISESESTSASKFWSSFWGSLLKVLGV